jgi:hypothetical protein
MRAALTSVALSLVLAGSGGCDSKSSHPLVYQFKTNDYSI